MGAIEKILAEVELPDRDAHNNRVFIDLAESVHIHYREHRLVFTVEEFREVARAFAEGLVQLEDRVQKGYRVDTNHPTVIIGGEQQKPINVPEPSKSYFNNRMVIEKSKPEVMDEIHIHYRDYRLVMKNRDTFERFCECVKEAQKSLG
jgi:hypothetical protein